MRPCLKILTWKVEKECLTFINKISIAFYDNFCLLTSLHQGPTLSSRYQTQLRGPLLFCSFGWEAVIVLMVEKSFMWRVVKPQPQTAVCFDKEDIGTPAHMFAVWLISLWSASLKCLLSTPLSTDSPTPALMMPLFISLPQISSLFFYREVTNLTRFKNNNELI